MKLMREWKRQVYYDQGGALSRRFMLQQTPAIVSQEDKRLRVDEIRP
jgi:conjugal transfer pilus assembly protein TraW